MKYVYIVFELCDEGSCLMEVFDTRKKANEYIRDKKKEFKSDTYRSHYYSCPEYQITKRKLL